MCRDIATPSGGSFEALIISSVLNITDILRRSSRLRLTRRSEWRSAEPCFHADL
jgi:hypothetical protein